MRTAPLPSFFWLRVLLCRHHWGSIESVSSCEMSTALQTKPNSTLCSKSHSFPQVPLGNCCLSSPACILWTPNTQTSQIQRCFTSTILLHLDSKLPFIMEDDASEIRAGDGFTHPAGTMAWGMPWGTPGWMLADAMKRHDWHLTAHLF